MARRRRFNVFSLSFLDVMSCGFGAVVLIYLIINHATEQETRNVNRDRLAEVRLLDYQVQNGERDLFELLERLEALNRRVAETDARLISTSTSIERRRQDFSELEAETLARIESIEALKSDLETREREIERLRAMEAASDGGRIRSFTGDGDRQYLTGMKVGGRHVLIAVDSSASMLDERIVNVIRRRNMPEDRRRAAPKWQRAVRTVEWLAAQLPLDAHFQVYGFNTEARSLVPNRQDEWVPLADGRELEAGLAELRRTVPDKGTSLINLVSAINALSPPPDNVYLIIDSLPTQGEREPRAATISGRDRLKLFSEAVTRLPSQVPINVILFPMEGDPLAAAAYWNIARISSGSFVSPSRDWP
ncbi:MAG: hypothetical protein KF911_15855 [Pseudomonadales bacterium]|nr:hypothetical protein [Pseudomonadales bacterium]